MVVRAYILMITRPGSEVEVAQELNKREEVERVDIVYGDYDLVVRVKVASMEKLRDFTYSLRAMKAIERSSTMIATD